MKYIYFYYIFVCIFNLGGFWKGGGHGMTEIKSGGWHTYHHMENYDIIAVQGSRCASGHRRAVQTGSSVGGQRTLTRRLPPSAQAVGGLGCRLARGLSLSRAGPDRNYPGRGRRVRGSLSATLAGGARRGLPPAPASIVGRRAGPGWAGAVGGSDPLASRGPSSPQPPGRG